MQKGDIFTKDGTKYAIKQIFLGGENGGRVDASKFKDGKLQKGRPCKFTVNDVKGLLGETTDSADEDVVEPKVVKKPSVIGDYDDSDEAVEEPSWDEVRDNRAVVEDLINQFRDSGTEMTSSEDW